jgi:hypothetical protein
MTRRNLNRALDEAERRAWDSLSRYKFLLFGYYAAQHVTLNKLNSKKTKRPNPFKNLVKLARDHKQALK